ncbi:uncharacterized protein [Coffea arabica]|uniref:Uncharacterized protein n=1 Tax=Coffea arabica TaxID=13443 RepID=A0A6P6VW92_COFAR|nr:protein FAM133-like [Coffea arabica]
MMDLETENRIAAILLKEAAELRRQAEKDGVEAYLRQPKVRGRPNSRFLTATVLGVQHANRAVEENEMWRARQKERELDDRLRGKMRDEGSGGWSSGGIRTEAGRSSKRQLDTDTDASSSCSLRKGDDEGLRDDEVEEFLHSRIKRGRGAVGSRMDETGPYLSSCPEDTGDKQLMSLDGYQREVAVKSKVLGPEKPSLLGHCESSDDDSFLEQKKTKKASPSKQHSKKHKLKHKDKENKKREKRREEKRHKHRK